MTNDSLSSAKPARIAAIVLCGGQSRRMGRSKAWLPFGDEVLLQRVVRLLARDLDPIVVVRARGQTLPELPKNVLVAEDAREDRGPLQAIASGLLVLQGIADVAFVSSTDAPFVNTHLVKHLEKLRAPTDDLVVPHARGRHHPLASLYAVPVLAEIEKMLAEDKLRVMDLLSRVRTRVVGEDELVAIDAELRFLSNVNTPAEYEAAVAEDAKH